MPHQEKQQEKQQQQQDRVKAARAKRNGSPEDMFVDIVKLQIKSLNLILIRRILHVHLIHHGTLRT